MLFLVGALAGLAYGLSAFGGSLLAVPLLVLLLHTPITDAITMNLCMLIVLATITAGDGVRARLPVPGLIWPFALVASVSAVVGVATSVAVGFFALNIIYPVLLILAAVFLLYLAWHLPTAVSTPRGSLAAMHSPDSREHEVPRLSIVAVLAGGGLGGFFGGAAGASGSLFLVPALGRVLENQPGQAVACAQMAVLPALLAATITALAVGWSLEWRDTGLMIFGALAGFSLARMLVPRVAQKYSHGLVACALLVSGGWSGWVVVMRLINSA